MKSLLIFKTLRVNIIGTENYTRFEIARIIGARALQISLGAPVLLKNVKNSSPIEIAKKEFEEGVIPLTVKRPKPPKLEE